VAASLFFSSETEMAPMVLNDDESKETAPAAGESEQPSADYQEDQRGAKRNEQFIGLSSVTFDGMDAPTNPPAAR
jgi:hypothetical protein